MDRHILIVANAFRAAGFLLGLPSLALCVWLGWGWIGMARSVPGEPVGSVVPTADLDQAGIAGLITLAGTLIGKGLWFASKASAWVLGVLTAATVALTLTGAGLWLIGHGLFLHALWARIVAGLAASGLLTVSFFVLTSLRRSAALAALIPLGMAIYVLWVLIRRFRQAA